MGFIKKKTFTREYQRKKRIKQLVRDVRNKYLALKLGRNESAKSIENLLAPISKRLDTISDKQTATILQHATTFPSKLNVKNRIEQKITDNKPMTFSSSIPLKKTVLPSASKMYQPRFSSTRHDNEDMDQSYDIIHTSSPFAQELMFDPPKPRKLMRANTSTPSEHNKQVEFLPTEHIAESYPLKVDENEDENDSVFLEEDGDPNESKKIYKKMEKSNSLEHYLEQYPQIVRSYIQEVFEESDNIDRVFGPKYNPITSKWYLGNTEINFDVENASLRVGNKLFPGTNGLYELLFHKQPVNYKTVDKQNYKTILNLTNVHKRKYDHEKPMKSSSSYKYKNIIRKLMQVTPTVASAQPTHHSGASLLSYNNFPIQYVYWDNVNELVDRLRLLYASKNAGNTSQNNEILSIIEELKEARIIN